MNNLQCTDIVSNNINVILRVCLKHVLNVPRAYIGPTSAVLK